jgi:spore coat polysaccharide biosynthesis protein SpsF
MTDLPETSIILLARYSSNRLPGKAMMTIHGIPLIGHIINRLKYFFGEDWGILATSVHASDDAIQDYAVKNGVKCFRGSLENVAQRFLEAALLTNNKFAVRITGDSLFIDQNLIREFVEIAIEGDFDLVSNRKFSSYPVGQTVEVVKVETFSKIYPDFSSISHFEHVTSYLYEPQSNHLKIKHMINPSGNHRSSSQAVDTPEDFIRAQKVFQCLGNKIYTSDYLTIEKQYEQLIER